MEISTYGFFRADGGGSNTLLRVLGCRSIEGLNEWSEIVRTVTLGSVTGSVPTRGTFQSVGVCVPRNLDKGGLEFSNLWHLISIEWSKLTAMHTGVTVILKYVHYLVEIRVLTFIENVLFCLHAFIVSCPHKAGTPSKTWTKQSRMVWLEMAFCLQLYACATCFVFVSRSLQGLAAVYLVFLLTSIRNAIQPFKLTKMEQKRSHSSLFIKF